MTILDEIKQDETVQHLKGEIIDASFTPRVMQHIDGLIERVYQICITDEWARLILEEQAREDAEYRYRCTVCGETSTELHCANECGFGDTMEEI